MINKVKGKVIGANYALAGVGNNECDIMNGKRTFVIIGEAMP